MTWGITTPVTGAAQTGFTAPTYTLTQDSAPDVNGKQHAVTALGGTQASVRTSAVADPFTITFWRAKVLKALGRLNPVTGAPVRVERNVNKVVTRKGVLVLANQPAQQMTVTTVIDCPAGADTADPANVKAALSLHIGALSQQSAGIGDTAISGVA